MSDNQEDQPEAGFPRDWVCKNEKCYAKLGSRLSIGRVSILGTNGQEYEIGFNYVDLVCRKCGKRNRLVSNVVDDVQSESQTHIASKRFVTTEILRTGSGVSELTPIRKHFFELTQRERDKFLPSLSQKQRSAYQIILGAVHRTRKQTLGDIIQEIAGSQNIDQSIVKFDVVKIIHLINEVRRGNKKLSTDHPFDKPSVDNKIKS